MSDELKKLLEGLPIKVLSKDDVEIDGGRYLRSQIKHWADNGAGIGQCLGWRVILKLMDEYEESAPVNLGREFEELKNYTIQECGKGIELKPTWEPGMLAEHFDYTGKRIQFEIEAVGGRYLHDRHGSSYFIGNCRHVPAPRKEAIAELARQEMADGHYVCDAAKEPESETDTFVAMPPKSERPVTMKVQREDSLTGPHWDLMNRQPSHNKYALCIRELADELRRMKEGK